MKFHQGRSFATDSETALVELTADWPEHARPDVVFVFASTSQDPQAIAAGLQARHPGALVVGCTTSGEYLDGQYSSGSVVATALTTPRVRWSARPIERLSAFETGTAQRVVDDLFAELDVDRETFNPDHYFSILFADGLQNREEELTAALADALEGVVLAGGSAGDDRRFEQTKVILGDRAEVDQAVLILAEADAAFRAIKHQHFETSDQPLAVTKVADDDPRHVLEIDGRPAVEAYADALGIATDQVDDEVASLHPLTFSCMGSVNVRSPLQIEADGSMRLGASIETGMVVDIGRHRPMVASLAEELKALTDELGDDTFLLANNCVFRSLEAKATGHEGELGRLIGAATAASVGFDTYGEQFNGLHVNQTLVALALAP